LASPWFIIERMVVCGEKLREDEGKREREREEGNGDSG
jgi:hypothetical protein